MDFFVALNACPELNALNRFLGLQTGKSTLPMRLYAQNQFSTEIHANQSMGSLLNKLLDRMAPSWDVLNP